MRRLAVLALLTLIAASCSRDSAYQTLDAPKKFFAENKVGTSPDYGIIKFKDQSDHVVSVHGFTDDQASCNEIAEALNTNACKETGGRDCLNPYSCIPLNGER